MVDLLTVPNALANYSKREVVIANNTFSGFATATVQTAAATSRSPHVIGQACTDIRFVYANSTYSGSATNWTEIDGPNDYPISASVEIGGTLYRLTFGGSTTGTVSPGGLLTSDPISVDLNAATLIYSRTYINSTNWIPNKASYDNTGTGGRVAGDSTGSGTIADSINYLFTPVAILGRPTGGAAFFAVIVGDSVDNGQSAHGSQAECHGYSSTDPTHNAWYDLAFAGTAGLAQISKSGDQAQKFLTTAGHFRRGRIPRFATHALEGYGRNDLDNDRTTAQIQADKIAVWTMLSNRGLKVWSRTITPETASTDTWATTANQTVSNPTREVTRVAVNQWLRAGAPIVAGAAVAVGTSGALVAGQTGHPLYGVKDFAGAVETAQDSGIWRAGYSTDGVHLKGPAHISVAALYSAAAMV